MDEHQSAWPRPAEPNQAMAVWSLVMSALPLPPLWPVSIGLGIAVLMRSQDGRNHGKALVIVGFSVIAGWLLVFAGIAAVVVAFETMPEPERVGARGEVYLEDLRVGDCTAEDLEDEVYVIELVPCDEVHRLEVYAVFDLPAGRWPGQKDVDRLGDGGCTSRFEEFIGIPYDDSEFDFQYLTPIEETWEDDRAVICLLDPGAKLAGTLKNEGS